MYDVYQLLKPLLFRLDAEASHNLTLVMLSHASKSNFLCKFVESHWGCHVPHIPLNIMGIDLPNPIGLAAGLDKNASAMNAFAVMGFGWLEVGTITPLPQPGNPKKRMFRVTNQEAIINRMGFNSEGLEIFLRNLKQKNAQIPIGVNIGKNAKTPLEKAAEDYVACLETVYNQANYVTINISSPNTKDLRELQKDDQLNDLLDKIKKKRDALSDANRHSLPIALKIAPDLNEEQIEIIAQLVAYHQLDAVIATNTTIQRPQMKHLALAGENGGLSGAPLQALSNEVIRHLRKTLNAKIPIIGVGGILSADDAWKKIEAGASAVQIYTGLIYHGPQLIMDIAERFAYEVRKHKVHSFSSLLEIVHSY